ncbi:MAG: FHA domain-containing protein [Acidimicrobiales bacterium]
MIDEVTVDDDDVAAQAGARPVLVARLGGEEIAVGPRDVVTVGRHRHSRLRSNHERVSRRHATIRGEPDGWYYVDEDSLNGSYLGDDAIKRLRIDTTVVLRLGDQRNGPILELYVPA